MLREKRMCERLLGYRQPIALVRHEYHIGCGLTQRTFPFRAACLLGVRTTEGATLSASSKLGASQLTRIFLSLTEDFSVVSSWT